MTLEELQVVITAQTSGLRREISNVQSQLSSLENSTTRSTDSIQSSFNSVTKTISSLVKAIATAKVIKIGVEGVTQLNAVQSSLNALNRQLGEESTNALQEWSDNTAKYLGLGRGEALKTAQFMGIMLSKFIDQKDVAQATKQLVGQMAIISQSTGKSMSYVIEAMQSAFVGSFERVENIIPTMTRALANNYAMVYYNAKSYASLTAEQQKFIMYQMIMAESTSMYGNTLGESAAMMNSVKASLQDMGIQFGAAFTYILGVAMPVIQAVVSGLQYLLAFIAGIAQAIASLFGKSNKSAKDFTNNIKQVTPNAKAATPVIGGVADGLNSAASGAQKTADGLSDAEKNAKKLKGSLMGFDEINTLNMDTGTTGSLGSLDSDGVEMPSMDGVVTDLGNLDGLLDGTFEKFNAFSNKMEEFKQKVANISEAIIGGVKKALPYIALITATIAGLFLVSGLLGWLGKWGAIGEVVGEAGRALMGYETIGQKVFKNLSSSIGGWKEVVKGAASLVVKELGVIGLNVGALMLKIPGLSGIGTALLGGSAGTLAVAGAIVIAIIATIVGAFVYLWNTSESFRSSWIEVWENVKASLKSVWENTIQPIFEAIILAALMIWEGGLKPLWEAWCSIWEEISGILTDFLNFLIPIMTQILNWLGPVIRPVLLVLGAAFGNMVNVALGFLTGLFNSVKDIIASVRKVFQGLIDFITGVFTGNWRLAWEGVKNIFGGIFDGLVSLAKAPLNVIIGAVNGVIKGLNKIKLPDWVPEFGGKGINIPEIPRLARGGVVNSGQMYIAGEAGREAIVPLDHNNHWASAIADTVLSKMGGNSVGQANDRPLEVILQVGTTKLGRVVVDSINKVQAQEGRVLINL